MDLLLKSPIGGPYGVPQIDSPSADEAARLTILLEKAELPPEFHRWLERYAALDPPARRGEMLWRWLHVGLQAIQLSCVSEDWCQEVTFIRDLAGLWIVLIDDLADLYHDSASLEALSAAVRQRDFDYPLQEGIARSPVEHRHLTWEVSRELFHRIERLPRSTEFRALLDFDIERVFLSMRYAGLLASYPDSSNTFDTGRYDGAFISGFATLDLMASPSFDLRDLGLVRHAIGALELCIRIGNLLSTWQHELGQGDLSSDIFAAIIEQTGILPSVLRCMSVADVQRLLEERGVEAWFLVCWERSRDRILELVDRTRTVDLSALAAGCERALKLDLLLRGRK